MKIVNKVLVSVEASDIVNGKFYDKSITEVADGCFSGLRELVEVDLPNVKKIAVI